MAWTSDALEGVLTQEEFLKKLEHLIRAWLPRDPRTLQGWLFYVELWAKGDH